MGHRRKLKLKSLLGIIKDKASLIKATLSPDRTTSSIRVAILRATSRSSLPPPEQRITAILSLGNDTRPTASTCIVSIMNRLHHTRSVFVALKSLMTLHNIISKGSFILKDQLSFYPTSGGRNSLNLSKFTDKTNVETWEFSSWVRWYATVLECNLIASRVLGIYFSSSPSSSTKVENESIKENLTLLLNMDLLREIEALVSMIEEICKAPESLDILRNELVYEVMKLVGEDYRMTQHHLMIRLTEFGDRIEELSMADSDDLTSYLKKIEDCRERVKELFKNRKQNDAFWDLISEIKVKVRKLKEGREMEMLNRKRIEYPSESTQFGKIMRPKPNQMLRLLPYGGNWSSVDRVQVQLTVSIATA